MLQLTFDLQISRLLMTFPKRLRHGLYKEVMLLIVLCWKSANGQGAAGEQTSLIYHGPMAADVRSPTSSGLSWP